MLEQDVLTIINSDAYPEWHHYSATPLPGWSSESLSLFDAPTGRMDADPDGTPIGVASVPFDSSASSRPGARTGPRQVRLASLAYSVKAQNRGANALINLRNGHTVFEESPNLVDYGDLHSYPSNICQQMLVTAAEASRIASKHPRCLFLGGDHSLTYPLFSGVARAVDERSEGTLGYVHIDNHFDLGRSSDIHGLFYHGSNSRRILERPRLEPSSVAFVGQGDLTSKQQYDWLLEQGVSLAPIDEIRELGIETSLRRVCDRVLQQCDQLYVSLDIDVCDVSVAAGTGSVTIGGFSAFDLLVVADVLKHYPVRALDVMEVAPSLEGGGNTPFLAARFLYDYLWLSLKE